MEKGILVLRCSFIIHSIFFQACNMLTPPKNFLFLFLCQLLGSFKIWTVFLGVIFLSFVRIFAIFVCQLFVYFVLARRLKSTIFHDLYCLNSSPAASLLCDVTSQLTCNPLGTRERLKYHCKYILKDTLSHKHFALIFILLTMFTDLHNQRNPTSYAWSRTTGRRAFRG